MDQKYQKKQQQYPELLRGYEQPLEEEYGSFGCYSNPRMDEVRDTVPDHRCNLHLATPAEVQAAWNGCRAAIGRYIKRCERVAARKSKNKPSHSLDNLVRNS